MIDEIISSKVCTNHAHINCSARANERFVTRAHKEWPVIQQILFHLGAKPPTYCQNPPWVYISSLKFAFYLGLTLEPLYYRLHRKKGLLTY